MDWMTRRIGAIAVLLAALALTALAFATSPAQPAPQPTDGLPAGKQSTRVVELAGRFPSGRTDAAVVVYERREGPLSQSDLQAVDATRQALQSKVTRQVVPPAVLAPDKQAALLAVPVPADLDDAANTSTVDSIRETVQKGLPRGLDAQVTGGPAIGRDIAAAFDGADVKLLLVTAAVVALLLLVTYRSPLLWIVPLLVIGTGDQLVAQLLPWVARLLGERTDASVGGIVSVLVFGAGTDYALLLISRYREQLRDIESRRAAMAAAVRRTAPAVLGSAATVILALLTLLAAVLTSNRTLGVAAALGVAVALVFGLVVLPAALVSLPRAIFWPFVPAVGGPDRSATGVWARIGAGVARRPGVVLAGALVVLAALAAGLFGTHIGLAQSDQFRTRVEAVTAQAALARHFPAGSAQPVTVIVPTASAGPATTAARGLDGVADVVRPERSDDGSLTKFSVELTADVGTPAADRTVRKLRSTLPAALVGGAPAADLDERDANVRDGRVIVPLILAVVLLVLIVLLRSLAAPVLLLVTVVVSFAASLGAASLALTQVLGIPALAANVPLLSFLFLVALGVDYNIFLVARARDEAVARSDTRDGMTHALAATGGVITSAGILLAAVFTVLGVLPVIVLTQIGVIVGLGVLLDTLLVRTVVVPAIALLLGERFWWPARWSVSGRR
jgi:putative drug exporter of the RND superfamily